MSQALVPGTLRAFMDSQDADGRSAEEAVTDAVRHAILRGILSPGQRLRQVGLAEELGVSRIPLRDAFRRLSAEGLIQIDGRRGARVASLTAADAGELYDLRGLIEIRCLRLAIQNLTDEGAATLAALLARLEPRAVHRAAGGISVREFYTELYHWSRRPRMAAMIIQLRHELNRYHALLGVPLSDGIHALIGEGIRTRDPEAATAAMRKHLRRSRSELAAALRESLLSNARPR